MTRTTEAAGLEQLLASLGLATPIPEFGSADVLNKPLDIGRSYLTHTLLGLVGDGADPEAVYGSISPTTDPSAGDLYVRVPKFIQGEDAEQDAVELMRKVPNNFPLFTLPFPEGVLLRFFFSKTLPRLILPYIKDRGPDYGKVPRLGLRDPASPSESARMKVVVEFSSPNIVSEFHARHLRSTILGAYIAKLHENMGCDVVRLNYLGDWGQHIGLFAAGWSRFGDEDKFKEDPVGHVLEVYAKVDELFQVELAESKKGKTGATSAAELESKGLFAEREAFFKRMEEGDDEAIALWKRVRDVSVEHYKGLYERLNVSFDEYVGESQVTSDSMAEVEALLKSKGLSEDRDGNVTVDFNKHGLRAGLGTVRKQGSSTYFLRDVASVLDRLRRYDFDRMVYVVSVDQETHFKKVFKTIELLDDEFPGLHKKLHRVHFGKLLGMSTELSAGHMLVKVLDGCGHGMKSSLEAEESTDMAALLGSSDETAEVLGINALLSQELSSRRINDHNFDIGKMTSFDAGTGPSLQHTHARLKKALDSSSANEAPDLVLDLSTLSLQDLEPGAVASTMELVRQLTQYPEVTSAAYQSMESAPVMTYLQAVAGMVGECLEGKTEVSGVEGAVLEGARQVMENAMGLLGMRVLA